MFITNNPLLIPSRIAAIRATSPEQVTTPMDEKLAKLKEIASTVVQKAVGTVLYLQTTATVSQKFTSIGDLLEIVRTSILLL
jgi:hypothetical protein